MNELHILCKVKDDQWDQTYNNNLVCDTNVRLKAKEKTNNVWIVELETRIRVQSIRVGRLFPKVWEPRDRWYTSEDPISMHGAITAEYMAEG